MNRLCDFCGKSIDHYNHAGCTPAGEAEAELMYQGGPMDASTIPAEIVEAAARAMWDVQTRQAWQKIDGDEWPSWVDLAARDRLRGKAREALAAVYPLIEAAALDAARKELQAAYKRGPGTALAGNPATWQKGFARAHRIIRDRTARLREGDGS